MHSQNRESIFGNACSARCTLFLGRTHPRSNALRATFPRKASAFAFQRRMAFLMCLTSLLAEAASQHVPFGERVQKLECCSRNQHSDLPHIHNMIETSFLW